MCVDVLLVNDTPIAEEVLVTTPPPPTVLKTTPPGTVLIATSFEAVDGASRIVVGTGTVEATISEERTADIVGATAATLVDVARAAVVVPLF